MASSFGNTVVAIILVSVCHSANAGAIWATNGHEYEVVFSHRIAWDTARSAAQGLGSGWDLATIGSAEENVFVASLLDAGLPERSHFWLGAADAVRRTHGNGLTAQAFRTRTGGRSNQMTLRMKTSSPLTYAVAVGLGTTCKRLKTNSQAMWLSGAAALPSQNRPPSPWLALSLLPVPGLDGAGISPTPLQDATVLLVGLSACVVLAIGTRAHANAFPSEPA